MRGTIGWLGLRRVACTRWVVVVEVCTAREARGGVYLQARDDGDVRFFAKTHGGPGGAALLGGVVVEGRQRRPLVAEWLRTGGGSRAGLEGGCSATWRVGGAG